MADARIRVELTAEDAKKKLKDYERGKKKAKKKADKAEKKTKKEKGRKTKKEEKKGGLLGALGTANLAIKSPRAALVSGAAKRMGGLPGSVAKALEVATLAYDTARAANDATIMMGSVLKDQGNAIASAVGAPLVAFGEGLKENVFDQAGKLMEVAKITAQSQVSFAKAKVALGPEALVGIAEFAFKEGGRKLKIQTREQEETGAMVGQIIKQVTGWGS